MKHSHGRGDFLCAVPAWVADVNHEFSPFCLDCDTSYRINGDRLDSASNLYLAFETKRDQWIYKGKLSEEDTEVINQDMEAKRGLFHDVTNGGPNNASYGALGALLEEYTERWDKFVNEKLEAKLQQARQKQDAAIWAEARLGTNLSDAMETQIYPAGFLSQQRSSDRSRSGDNNGSSSSSRHRPRNYGSSSRHQGSSSRHQGSSSGSHGRDRKDRNCTNM
ncbi:hypothetical protein Daus18300_004291 [Diaporthe australafricana]|uniref:Uncharacterized protein n=1 Tax=Diaporthe australafricana TaxID=127596 RepID=A0ABR3XAQ4_9PEZI